MGGWTTYFFFFFNGLNPKGQFTDSPAAIIAQVLIDTGFAVDPSLATGTATNWPVSVSSELDLPDSVIEIHDTEPVDRKGRNQVTGEELQLWGFQLLVRSADPQLNFQKMNALEIFFSNQTNLCYARQTTLTHADSSTSTYLVGRVTKKSGPLYLGRETGKSKRHLRSLNAIVDIVQLR